MFKVECPGCSAPYQVDERRVPASGLKMRCPKCGASFKVDPKAQEEQPEKSNAEEPGLPMAAPPRPPGRPGRNSALRSTMVGLPPPRTALHAEAAAATAPAPVPAAPARTFSGAYDEVDLPTIGHGARRDKPNEPAAKLEEPDLPAPVVAKSRPEPSPPRPPPPPVRPAAPPPVRPAAQPPARPAAQPPARPAAQPPASHAAPPFKHRAPPKPERAPSSVDFSDLDLPAALGPPSKVAPVSVEPDLPAVSRASQDAGAEFDPTAIPTPEPAVPDLPSVSAGRPQPGFGQVDLPSPIAGAVAPRPGKAAPRARSEEMDLPAALDVVGLPSPAADLPSPAAALPSMSIGLPTPAAGLPSPAEAALPSPAAGLPNPVAPALPSPVISAAPMPTPAAGSANDAGMLSFELSDDSLKFEPPELDAPPPRAPSGAFPLRLAGKPESAELQLPDAGRASDPGRAAHDIALVNPELDADPFRPSLSSASDVSAPTSDAPVVRQAGGGVTYGEVNLDGGEPLRAAAAPAASSDDMEFGAIPEEAPKGPTPAGHVQLATSARPRPGPAKTEKSQPSKQARKLRFIAGLTAAFAIGGGALALVPSVGPFGAYWIADRLKGGEYEKLLTRSITEARSALASDTYPDAQQAVEILAAARGRAKRTPALAAYTAFTCYARDLRFGPEPEMRARAQVLLEELREQGEVPYLQLARAAQGIVSGQLPRARQELQRLARLRRDDIDVLVLQGELELRARDAAAALAAWNSAAKVEVSPRTAFGLARAQDASGDTSGALASAQRILQQSPAHVGARILSARLSLHDDPKRAVELLQQIAKDGAKASPEELVDAQTVIGDAELGRSRVTHAEAAYGEALKLDPKSARALIGLGDVLYRAGRFSEALAHFEAASQADPESIAAQVGVAKAKLGLERGQDANARLKALREAHPESIDVAYWYAQSFEALGDRKQAEALYRAAIDAGKDNPESVDSYIALSQLLNQQGRSAEAQRILADARSALHDSARLQLGLGELALGQGHYAEAIDDFRGALKAEPNNVLAKFRLGVALRRNRNFDEAQKMFDSVIAEDRDYPGLALERGLLYEASGHAVEALEAYESALAKAPDDPDLMLRVGCGKIATGHVDQAQEILRKVQRLRPNSAEGNHCLGRAILFEGKDLPEALRMLDRATELDPNRAEYWLYVGWAANESGRVGKAEEALKKALSLDQSLADAYWQRGVLRSRQGAVKDALKDLVHALELRPSRFEAHAALAEVYDELGQQKEALGEWDKAVQAQPENAVWQFRYGKLMAVNHREGARDHLAKAIEFGEKTEPRPAWLPEAHLQMARVLGDRAEAAAHWEAFLKQGPRESVYRAEAKEALKRLGRPWDGE